MKFYKITSDYEENHGIYTTGLNNALKPFDVTETYPRGGIEFYREEILSSVGMASSEKEWIREITVPENEPMYCQGNNPLRWRADKIEMGEKHLVTPEIVKQLISEGANPAAGLSNILRWASREGFSEIVELVLPACDPSLGGYLAFRSAIWKGHTDIVKILLPVSAPQSDDCKALRLAVEKGHTEIVKLLIPFSDPAVVKSLGY